jgi:tetratricopeptide (TPR) repeat protein
MRPAPFPAFLQSLRASLAYWHTQVQTLEAPAYLAFESHLPNLLRALEAGFAFPETQTETASLALDMFDFIELRNHIRGWIPILEQALPCAPPQVAWRGKLLNQLGFLHMLNRAFREAEACHREAETLALAHGFAPELANAWFGLSQVALSTHQYAPAETYAHRALEHFVKLKVQPKIISVHNVLGRIALEKGAYLEAEGQFMQAVTLRRLAGPSSLLAQSLNNLALSLQGQKKYAAARAAYEEALEMVAENSPLIKIGTQNSLGALYFALACYAEAEKTFLAMDVGYLRRVGAFLWLGSRANNLGNVYLKQQAFSLAEAYLSEAVAHWQKVEDEINLANTLGDLAETLAAQKRTPEADRIYQEALQLLEKYPQNAWARDRQARLVAQKAALEKPKE